MALDRLILHTSRLGRWLLGHLRLGLILYCMLLENLWLHGLILDMLGLLLMDDVMATCLLGWWLLVLHGTLLCGRWEHVLLLVDIVMTICLLGWWLLALHDNLLCRR